MLWITEIGGLIGFLVIAFLVFMTDKEKNIFWNMVIAVAINFVFIIFLKAIILRPRPESPITALNEPLSSFPSGHSSRAFTMFGVLASFYKEYIIGFYLIAILIAFSRLYLGVHYLSDVIFGSLIGVIIAQLVVKYEIAQRIRRKIKKQKSK